MNGQKCIPLDVSPNSRVIQVQLLTGESPRPIVLIPKIIFQGKVGKNGINFMRVQFPLRTAYSMTINKSQDQTLSRIGLDLRSSAFAHGQLYVALSRAQNRQSVMCLLPHEHVLHGVPYTENVVYPPFTEAANEESDPDLLPDSTSATQQPNPPAPPPTWTVYNEMGDEARDFRALARKFLGNPDLHLIIGQQVVQYLADNRYNHDFHIDDGIDNELLYGVGLSPCTYSSYDDYLTKMSMPQPTHQCSL